MLKKRLFTGIILLSLIFYLLGQAVPARADDLIIQDEGNIELIISNNGVLGVLTSSAPQSNSSQHSEQKQQSSPPPTSNPASQAPTKTVPLVSSQTQSTVQINAPINDDKKVQVTITTGATAQHAVNSSVKTQPTQIPSASNVGTGTIQANTKSINTTRVITKSVDRVIAQGANGQPVITIKSDQAHQLTIQQGPTQVTTNLPLQIDTPTHSLSVSSQKQSTINVLPSEALQGIHNEGTLNTQSINQAKINLTQDESGVNYTVNSQKQGKLFGVFSVKSPVQIKLSAQTGKIQKTSQSFIFNLFGGFIK